MSTGPIIAAFGDSLFEGWGLELGQDAPTRLHRELVQRGRQARMLNFGISGDTAGDGLRRLDRVRAARPDVALVEFGANDFYQGVDPAVMEEQLATIIAALQADCVAVTLVGIRCLPEFTGQAYADRFAPVHARLAERFALPLAPDIFAAYLHRPELVLPDGIHPNSDGAAAIADYLLPYTLTALDAFGQCA